MTNKKYIVLITNSCFLEEPTVCTKTYIIPISSEQSAEGKVIYISNLEKINNQEVSLSVKDICRLIFAQIPKYEEILKIMVDSLGIGRAIYEEIGQIIHNENLNISIEEIKKPFHIS